MRAKLLMLALVLVALSLAVPAMATTITYTTTGTLSCGGNANCTGSGSSLMVASTSGNATVTVTFNGLGSTSVNTAGGPPETTFGSFGSITVTCVGSQCGSNGSGNIPVLTGLGLTINISQTVPGAGTTAIPVGAISGSINGSTSSAVITWSNPAAPGITAGGFTVTYSVSNNPLNLTPLSSNTGNTSIQALISDVPVGGTSPEPTSMLLFGSGFLALGLVARARHKRS